MTADRPDAAVVSLVPPRGWTLPEVVLETLGKAHWVGNPATFVPVVELNREAWVPLAEAAILTVIEAVGAAGREPAEFADRMAGAVFEAICLAAMGEAGDGG